MDRAKKEEKKLKQDQYLAVDIGGTVVKYSLFHVSFEELEHGEEATEKEPKRFLEQIVAVAERYRGRIAGIGICMAGFIDPVTGENQDFSVGENFRAWNLKEELSGRMGLPVVLENDSNCAALGELAAGAGRGLSNLALLTIGTGVGGALVLDGRLIRGSHFKAGEAGLALLGKEAGGTGYVSAEATSALVRSVSAVVSRQIDGPYVFGHLEEPDIEAAYRKWLEPLALTTGNLAVMFDPEAVLIGGGICRQARFINDLRQRVYTLFPHLGQYTRIEACRTGNLAGRIGVLKLLLAQI